MNQAMKDEILLVESLFKPYETELFTNDDFWQLDIKTDKGVYELFNRKVRAADSEEQDEQEVQESIVGYTLRIASAPDCDLCVEGDHMSDDVDTLILLFKETEARA